MIVCKWLLNIMTELDFQNHIIYINSTLEHPMKLNNIILQKVMLFCLAGLHQDKGVLITDLPVMAMHGCLFKEAYRRWEHLGISEITKPALMYTRDSESVLGYKRVEFTPNPEFMEKYGWRVESVLKRAKCYRFFDLSEKIRNTYAFRKHKMEHIRNHDVYWSVENLKEIVL